MGNTVEVYVKYAGGGHWLARRSAELVGGTGYFFNGHSHVISVDASPWVGEQHWGHLDLCPTDLGEYGELGSAEGTAFAPYEFDLALECRGGEQLRERIGRALFDDLTALGLPLAYGQGGAGAVYADFLPERGVRTFPPGTAASEDGREHWYEPRLHSDPMRPWNREPVAEPASASASWPMLNRTRRVRVFETAGLLQFVTSVVEGGLRRWICPVATVRSSEGPGDIGRMLGYALRGTAGGHPGANSVGGELGGGPDGRSSPASRPGRLARPGSEDRDLIMASLGDGHDSSVADFVRRSVSVEIRADGNELTAFLLPLDPLDPHDPLDLGDPGSPAAHELLGRRGMAVEPEALGELVLDLIGVARSRAPG